MVAVLSPERSSELINRFYPKLFFETVKSRHPGYDFPCSFNFGPWKRPEDVLATKYAEEATMYYSVMGDNYWIYLLACVYHFYDPVAPHRHDFTYLMLKIQTDAMKIMYRVSRSHFDLLFEESDSNTFLVESGSHSIIPKDLRYNHKDAKTYTDWNFVNMRTPEFLQHWETIRQQFGENVLLPDQVNSRNLIPWAGKSQNRTWLLKTFNIKSPYEMEGLLWKAPDTLFAIAEKAGKFK